MLGNKKLADGNMCKNCARKLSPFCDDRRQSTLQQIKAHLQYREENKAVLRAFTPNVTLGEYEKFYINTMDRTFVVSGNTPSDWDKENPDVIPMAQITSCVLDIDEDRREIFYENQNGDEVSFNPPRYEYSYDFILRFRLNNPYFDDFDITLNRSDVEGRNSMEYNRYQQMASEIMNALDFGGSMPVNGINMGMNSGMGMNNMGGFVAQQNQCAQPQQNMYGQPQQNMYAQQNQYGQPQQNNSFNQQPMQSPATNWVCSSCNATNTGAFCECCGTRKV